MKVCALKRLVGSYGLLNKGDVIDLPNYLANDLLALGYAEAVTEERLVVEQPKKKRGRSRDDS